MIQPDPNQFARLVLHHLVRLRFDLAKVRSQVQRLYVERFGQDPEADQIKSEQEAFEALYQAALSEAGLSQKAPRKPPPESEPSAPDDASNGDA